MKSVRQVVEAGPKPTLAVPRAGGRAAGCRTPVLADGRHDRHLVPAAELTVGSLQGMGAQPV